MPSAASHRADEPPTALPTGPGGGPDLFAPATPGVQPPVVAPVVAPVAAAAPTAAGHRPRHRLDDAGEPGAGSTATGGTTAGPAPVVEAPAPSIVPAVPLPVFDVPEVRVPGGALPVTASSGAEGVAGRDPDRTDPVPGSPADAGGSGRSRRTPANPLFTDAADAPPGDHQPAGPTAVPGPTRSDPTRPQPPTPQPPTPRLAPADPTRPHVLGPRSSAADPPVPPADATSSGAHRSAPPPERPRPTPPAPGPPAADNPVRPTERVFPGRVRPPAQGGSPGPPPAQASSPRLPPVQTSSPGLPWAGGRPQPGPQPGTRPGTAPPGSSATQGTVPGMPARPGPPRAPVPAPAPASPRDPGLDGRLGVRAPHGDGIGRRAARFALHLVTTTRATRELAELAGAAQAPVTTGRRIAVVSVCGGAGRSTVTTLLGSVFALRRADHVLVADADPEHGSLAWRLGLAERDGLAALGPRLLAARGIADLDTLLPRTPAGLRLLPGPAGTPPGATREVTRAMSRFFAVCVTDCGRGLQAPATAEVLQDAHAAVVVAPATPDGVRSTLAGLAQVPPALLQRTVIALNTTGRGGRAALHVDVANEVLTRTGAALIALPYDRHLAAATPVLPGRLSEATTIAATRLAGHALHRAGQPVGSSPGGPR